MKMKVLLLSGLFLLLIATSVSAGQMAEVNKSTENKGIRLTIKEVGLESGRLNIEYAIKSDTNYNLKEKEILLETPDLFINGNHLNSSMYESYNQIAKNKYMGLVTIDFPKNISSEKFNFKFNTDKILNKEGQWTISALIKTK